MGYDNVGMGGVPAGDKARAASGSYDEVGTFTKPSQIGKPETKTFAKPISAQTQATQPAGEFLRYPINTNYLASMIFRVKSINPWDVDLNLAKEIFDAPLLYGEDGLIKPKGNKTVENETTESNYEIDGVQTDEDRARARLAESEDDYSAAGAEAASFDKRVAARQQAEAGATKGLLGVKTQYVAEADTVVLYMPQAVNINDTVNYDTPDLGAGGASALAALNNAGGLLDAAQRALKETFAPLTDLFNSNLVGPAARLAASRAASKFLPRGLEAAAQIGLQVKVNPNTRAVFGGVNIRQFTFQYDFIPTSASESQQVARIIKHFRKELYPTTFGREDYSVPIGYKFPNLFEIKFRWADRTMDMPQPILCYLKDVQTTYNPQSQSFHVDGTPSQISLTLIFQEFRALTREDVEAGN